MSFLIYHFFYSFFFFFSSRRRHTRSLCDWSSDVCSSDLAPRRRSRPVRRPSSPRSRSRTSTRARPPSRSEERRVGKECRSRWSTEQEKIKNGRDEETKHKEKYRCEMRLSARL